MRAITIGNEKNMDELVTRLYGRISKTKSEAATEALKKANPHLDTAPKKGTVLVVPDALDIPLRKQAEASDPIGELEQAAAAAVAAFREHLASVARAEAERAAADTKLLKSARMKRLIEERPELKEHATLVAKAIKARQTQTKAVQKVAANDFAALEKRLGPASGKPRS